MNGIDPGWVWPIGGVLMLILEVIAPRVFLVFIGASAIPAGLVTVLFGLPGREAVAALAASTAFPARALTAPARPTTDVQASATLDTFAEHWLQLSPEAATSLGIDTGKRAALRTRLGDRSAAGQQRVAATVRADLARAEAIDTSALSFPVRTNVEVVRSAYKTPLEGYYFPHCDVP